MIHYSLTCEQSHSFEGWFRNSGDFDAQTAGGLVACPICGSTAVTRGLMAPAIQSGRSREARANEARAEAERAASSAPGSGLPIAAVPTGGAPGAGQPSAGMPSAAAPAIAESGVSDAARQPVMVPDPRQRAMLEALRELRQKVVEHADYVGPRFAEEARRMHYGETEHRGIYGEASPDEARALAEEGIEVHPLPALPEDRN